MGPSLSAVEVKIEQLLDAWGYELVRMRYYHHRGRGSRLSLVIDKPGGVNVGDCQKVYERIGDYLDVLDPIPGPYTLEVSSPGLDRLLTKDRHFLEVMGRQIRVRLRRKQKGRRNIVGALRAVNAEYIQLETEGRMEDIARRDIDEARAIYQWE